MLDTLTLEYADKDESETLEIYMKDTATDVEVTLKYGVLSKEDVITRSVVITNQGEAFYTPEVILSCSTEGFAKLSQQFHSVI